MAVDEQNPPVEVIKVVLEDAKPPGSGVPGWVKDTITALLTTLVLFFLGYVFLERERRPISYRYNTTPLISARSMQLLKKV